MQSKGAIRLFAILLALVCIYQLSFTFISQGVEDDAKEYAKGDPQKEVFYLDSISSQPVYNLLFKKYTYSEVRDYQMNLGLDLKGGMNVTLEVSLAEMIQSLSNLSTDSNFLGALEDAKTLGVTSQEDFVTLFGRAFEKRNPSGKLAAIFSTKELQDKIPITASNQDVLKVIGQEANDAIDRSFNVLRTRIDKFGVTAPNIQKLAGGRILIELPGVKEPDRVRKLLQGTAKLEFWETLESKDMIQYLAQADSILKLKFAGDSAYSDSINAAKSDTSAVVDTAVAAIKDSASNLLSQVAGSDSSNALDSTGTGKDPARENPLFVLLRPAIEQDEKGGSFVRKGPVLGYAHSKDIPKIQEYFALPEIKALFPRELKPLWTAKPIDKEGKIFELIAIKVTNRDGRAPLEGDVVTDARQDFGQFNNDPEISMSMNAEGARIWKRMTGENVGKSVAVVLDNFVYSYPNVIGEIPSGQTSITGKFSINEAKDLANILKAGKLPAPARIVQEAVVGPSLGQEAINAGFLSFVIALLVILVYMVVYYSNSGWVADFALFANIFFIMGILASLRAVLTLPGIAGLVLTIGLSVDANILIFERVREEMLSGKGLRLAISDGFKHAFSSIIDSNVTTLLMGMILYIFGSGPIQGFATTLMIGIICSLFSAIFITRLIFEWMLDKNMNIRFWTPLTKGAFKNININFVGRRKMYYAISGTIILLGIISFAMKGVNYGVDFIGGRTFVVRFEQPVKTVDVIDALKVPLTRAPEVKTFGAGNQVRITTSYLIDDNSTDAEQKVFAKLNEGLAGLNQDFEVMSSQNVGPTVASDIKSSAVWAILVSCILMFIYIFIRFSSWQYGLGAVAALVHDVLIVLSVFSVFNGLLPFSLEIDQAFIAATLTVMGYSMTDTVVVFDRIREYLGMRTERKTMKETINTALNATLSRTINTSLTIFFVLLAIFIFGGEVIRGFSFALLIGIVVGTYSSLCIATPIVIDFQKKEKTPEPVKV